MMPRFLPPALAACLLAPVPAALAQQAQPPRIVVIGEGESAIAPDLAMLSLSVMREAKTAREAMDASNAAMAAVIAAVKAAGVADRDLQTGGLQINPRYNYVSKPDGTQEGELVAYQVSNTLSIRVRDLAKTGEIIDKALELGVNQGGGVSFANEDPSKALTEARKLAVKNAMEKARTLSEAAGVDLGRVLEISDQTYAAPPMPITAKAFDRAGAESVPIETGENSYKVQVTVTFELR
ncbi:SIMPL domain-containing protein [Mesorhizobium sp. LHD-90]|uniref:SIMPL domain-containing protein n=1 Tax=Mesorhizobium sp. LHD-90 TaxID=3071414 RepID=UPI0027E01481|nr:SIMPL domain-containing protein [Mesorhizobium sp. LHD-90]MDQ6438175.1 SIMPL domain-containing protein [Mesorhizobium sp. LHD-90]